MPNAVTDEMFLELRKHWSEDEIVEIVGVISVFGFLNRWNDTLATPLEDSPLHFGEQHLAVARLGRRQASALRQPRLRQTNMRPS